MPRFIYYNSNPPPVASTVTYLGSGTSFNIGAARPDCVIVALGFLGNDGAATMSSMTIGGVAGTILYNPTASDNLGMAYRNVTTGGTITIAASPTFAFYYAYMINGLTNNTAYSSNSAAASGTTITTTVATPTSLPCAIINMARSRGSQTTRTLTATGAISGSPTLNVSLNTAGGANPSLMVGYGVATGLGGNVTMVDTANAWSSGLGFTASFY
jgi:hypothetical protein